MSDASEGETTDVSNDDDNDSSHNSSREKTKDVSGRASQLTDPLQEYYAEGIAARNGDFLLLKDLVKQGRFEIKEDIRGWTALHEAAFHNNIECLEFLLQQDYGGKQLMRTTRNYETPLMLAARSGNLQCVRLLVNRGAEINDDSTLAYPPLCQAVLANSLECVEYLLDQGADINHDSGAGYRPVDLAAEKGYLSIVDLLLGHNADIDSGPLGDFAPFVAAARFGHTDCLESLLKFAKDRGQINVINELANGTTPLIAAARGGHESCIKLLLEYHADPDLCCSSDQAVAAHYAIDNNHSGCLKLLLPVTDKICHSYVVPSMHPLVLAIKRDSIECLEILLSHGIDMCTKLHVDLPAYIIDLGYRSEASVLCQVDELWSLNAVRFLLDRGLPCDVNDQYELPPLIGSLLCGNSDLFTILLGYGANPNIYHPSADGNVAPLIAMLFDLTTQNILDVNRRKVYGKELSKLVIVGADLNSCVDCLVNNPDSSQFNFLLDKFGTTSNVLPVLTILFSFCNNLYIHQDFKKKVYTDMTDDCYSHFNRIEESTRTLAHACRQCIVRTLVVVDKYTENHVRSLPLSKLQQDIVLFLDFGDYASGVIVDSLTHARFSFKKNKVNINIK